MPLLAKIWRHGTIRSNAERELDYAVFGERFEAKTGATDIFQNRYDGKLPVVIGSVFHETYLEEEAWTKDLVERLSSKTVQFDIRDTETGEVEIFEGQFNDYLESCSLESHHRQSFYFMSETILSSAQDLMEKIVLPKRLFGENYFETCFPKKMRPQTALIIGGFGARSFLHADPYEWTGWNLLLEGKKLWIFFPPDEELHKLIQPSRNEVDAWGGVNISAGWISDVDLYKNVVLKEEDMNSLFGKVLVENLPSGVEIPCFNSGIDAVDNANPGVYRNVVCIVQEEGEMVIIPPKWWHQVYHLEPSIALAGQYFNNEVKENVFNHICSWSNVNVDCKDDIKQRYGDENENMKYRILDTIEIALISQHGEDVGRKILDDILS